MPKKPRIKSKSGIYHIVMRGINRQTVFEDEKDREKYIDTLKNIKTYTVKLYVYCLMSNHLHLILKEDT